MQKARNVIVTGANTGIGLGICRKLLSTPNIHLVYTYRNDQRGSEALKELVPLISNNLSHHQLDITDSQSIDEFKKWCSEKFPEGIDILINNAAIASKGSALNREIVETTFATNYYGVKNLTNSLYDILKDGSRVVNVSSGMGQATGMDKKKKDEFLNDKLTIEGLESLLNDFLDSVDNDTWEEKGYVGNSYSISKLAVNALTRIWARDDKRGISFVSVCPGWVKTNMGGENAPRSTDQGAESVCFGAFSDAKDVNGRFFRDGAELTF